jgi:spore coat protein CotH
MTRRILIVATVASLASAALPHAAVPQGGRGPGGPGGPQEIKIVKQFDKDGDGRLNAAERKAALEFVSSLGMGGGPGGRMGGPMGFGPRGGGSASGSPGPKIAPRDVKSYVNAPLYDAQALRTIFLTFEDTNWEQELMAFKNTDVEVPATAIVDGVTYKDVGIRFRGMSSFMSVPEGLKHSINVSMDFAHPDQRLGGYRTLNLLNSHEDPTYLRSILYYDAARDYIPAPRANYMRVAINGKSWGVYVNVEQFNKDSVKEWYGTTDGARWKVPGNPGARGGLEYLGDDAEAYKRHYEIKSKDDRKSWADFITLCRVLNQTPADKLEAALAPILDVDETLKFLALDNALVNNDGYWIRASDYSIYEDVKGRFHTLPQDANETFSAGGGSGGRGGPGGPGGPGRGPGGPGGRGRGGPPDFGGGFPGMPPGGGRPGGPMMMGGGPDLDPFIGLDDATKPLRSKLLAMPALRARYLTYVKAIATKWLDWNTLGPLAQKYQAVIADDVKTDTRKLDTFEEFQSGVDALRTFAERRRALLLNSK